MNKEKEVGCNKTFDIFLCDLFTLVRTIKKE